MDWVQMGIVLAGLGVNTILDIWKKRVSVLAVVLMAAAGVAWRVSCQNFEWIDLAWGLVPGMAGLVTAVFTKESIGYGDVWQLFGLGLALGSREVLSVSMAALLLAGIWALILVCLFHKERKYEIPFVPFLLLGYFWTVMG